MTILGTESWLQRTASECWVAYRTWDLGEAYSDVVEPASLSMAQAELLGGNSAVAAPPNDDPFEQAIEVYVSHDAPVGAQYARLQSVVGAATVSYAHSGIPIGYSIEAASWGASTPGYGTSGSAIASGSVTPGSSVPVDAIVPVVGGRVQFVLRIDLTATTRNGRQGVTPGTVVRYPSTPEGWSYDERVGLQSGAACPGLSSNYCLTFYDAEVPPPCTGCLPFVGIEVCDFETPISWVNVKHYRWHTTLGLAGPFTAASAFHEVGTAENVYHRYLLAEAPGLVNHSYRVEGLILDVRRLDANPAVPYPVGVTLYKGTGTDDDTPPTARRPVGDEVLFTGLVTSSAGVVVPTFEVPADGDVYLRLWGVMDRESNTPSLGMYEKVQPTVTLISCGLGGTPGPGQFVQDEYVTLGNGVATTFVVDHAYAPRSLQVEVDGIRVGVYESNPATGHFVLSFAPLSGEVITATYQGA